MIRVCSKVCASDKDNLSTEAYFMVLTSAVKLSLNGVTETEYVS